MSVEIDVRRYLMMRRKLLHRMKEVCGATSRMMKDELKSVRVHFAPGSNGRSFPLEYS